MRSLETYDRVYHRRLAGSALVVVALHAGLALLPVRRASVPIVAGPTTPRPGGTSIVEIEWLAGSSLAPEPTRTPETEPEPAVVPPPPEIVIDLDPEPEPERRPRPEAVIAPEPGRTGTDDLGPGTGASQPGATRGTGGAPVYKALRPRHMVHPQNPERIVAERKIDDFVRLRALVGPDGRVRHVQVLRSIPNCEECNQSAREAVWKLRYDPPLVDGRPAEVWTEPIQYYYGRRASGSP